MNLKREFFGFARAAAEWQKNTQRYAPSLKPSRMFSYSDTMTYCAVFCMCVYPSLVLAAVVLPVLAILLPGCVAKAYKVFKQGEQGKVNGMRS